MPPVDEIKNFQVDPYTLQVIDGGDKGEEGPLDDSNQPDLNLAAVSIPTKPTGWDLRKPDKMTASRLKTGYEQIIQRQLSEKNQKKMSDNEIPISSSKY